MALSPRLLHRIRQMIADAHSAFVINYISPTAVPPDVLERLRRLGMVRPRIRSLDQAYQLGRLIQVASAEAERQKTLKPAGTGGLRVGGKPGVGTPVLKDAQGKQVTLDALQGTLRRDPIPLTPVERNALDIQATKTAQYIVGLGNRVEQQTGNLLIEVDKKLDRTYRQVVQNAVQGNIARRETVQRLRSDLGHLTGDWSRDLDRIAVTEKQNALQIGYAQSVESQFGDDARVFKLVAPSACSTCRRLYCEPDGRPRVFSLTKLRANGSNFGKKAAAWQACVEATHPSCLCALQYCPPGATPQANGRFTYASQGASSKKSSRPRLSLRKA